MGTRAAWLVAALAAVFCCASPADYFRVTIVDSVTGRGVPCVQLTTVNLVTFYTDSAGTIAIGDPDLLGQAVWFNALADGYVVLPDGFGYSGYRLQITAGGSAQVQIVRTNLAQRLYRLTGGGIYADTVLTGGKPPIAQPLLNAQVIGQDSVLNAVYRGKLYW